MRGIDTQKAARAFMTASRTSLAAVIAELDHAARQLAPQIDTVLFLTPVDGALVCIHATGDRAEYFHGARRSVDGASPAALALSLGHRVVPRPGVQPVVPGDRTFIAVPLADDIGSVGVLYVASKTDATAFAFEPCVALAELAVPACRLALQRELDWHRATFDALTGLLTPKAFRDRLRDLCWALRAHSRATLTLLFIDTDNFKACNDALGHAAGDAVLRALGRILLDHSGQDALVGRNGGDEFCVLFPGALKTEGVRLAEQLRKSIEIHPFASALDVRRLPAGISASIGVAAFPTDARSSATLLERADAAMYFAKRSGRNRVAYYRADGTLAIFVG
jgi:diguanylate cyclase (GGDEF)-like protein